MHELRALQSGGPTDRGCPRLSPTAAAWKPQAGSENLAAFFPPSLRLRTAALQAFALAKDSDFGKIHLMGISPRQFEQMKQRVGGGKRVAEPLLQSSFRVTEAKRHQVILGIDPSLRGTGFGIIRLAKTAPELLSQGTIHCPPGWERSRCLVRILHELRQAIQRHHPTVCIIEGLFYAQNLQTALLMGEARGASLVAAAEAGLEIFELAPRKVKQAIVGYGAAQKSAVGKMVQRMLRLPEPPAPDAADALALALTHAQETARFSLIPPKRI